MKKVATLYYYIFQTKKLNYWFVAKQYLNCINNYATNKKVCYTQIRHDTCDNENFLKNGKIYAILLASK